MVIPEFKRWQWVTLLGLLLILNVVIVGGLAFLVTTYSLWSDPEYLAAEPTIPADATPTPTQRPTFTPTFTPEVWPTITTTRTPMPTASPTVTWTPLPTRTPVEAPTSQTNDAAASPTQEKTATATRVVIVTSTPKPTVTSTATRVSAPLPTSTSTPRPVARSASSSGVAQVAMVSETKDTAVNMRSVSSPADVKLSWQPMDQALAYRLYSDMGTGYGVYVFKAQSKETAMLDSGLCSGRRYNYLIETLTRSGERIRVGATAVTQREQQLVDVLPVVTPSPTAVVRDIPTPTPLPPDTVVLGLLSANDYRDETDGSWRIVGEIRNDSGLDVTKASIFATFYDAEGHIVRETSVPSILSTLPPGDRSPFEFVRPIDVEAMDYSLRATGTPNRVAVGQDQIRVVSTRRYEDDAGFYHVAGVVENPGRRRIESPRIVVTVYDRKGRVINVGFAYPQPATLAPLARADFDVSFTYYPGAFSHQVNAALD